MNKIKALFFAASPVGSSGLMVEEEIRAITKKIRATDYRDSIELVPALATRPDDLIETLNQHKPQIVHFSAHGKPTGEILLLDKVGGLPKAVKSHAIRELFKTMKDNIRVVLLNACYSKVQARQIVKVIDCAIGIKISITNQAAIAFAASFYGALGFGRSVKEAYEQGRAAILLEGIDKKNIPELLVKEGVDPSRIFLRPPLPPKPEVTGIFHKDHGRLGNEGRKGASARSTQKRRRPKWIPLLSLFILIIVAIIGFLQVPNLFFDPQQPDIGANGTNSPQNGEEVPPEPTNIGENQSNGATQTIETQNNNASKGTKPRNIETALSTQRTVREVESDCDEIETKLTGSKNMRLSEKLELFGRIFAYNIEKKLIFYHSKNWKGLDIKEKRLRIIFLYSRGLHFLPEDLTISYKEYIYEHITNSVAGVIREIPFLKERIEVLKIDSNKCKELNDKQPGCVLKKNEFDKIGLKEQANAVYEILLSADKVKKELHIGGKLILNEKEYEREDELVFIEPRIIPAAELSDIDSSKTEELPDPENAKKLDVKAFVSTVTTPVDKTQIMEIEDNWIFKGKPILFKFKLPFKGGYFLLLSKTPRGHLINMFPGTTNAITNGDYKIPDNLNSPYTDIQDKSTIDYENGRDPIINIGMYELTEPGTYSFYFYFLSKPNRMLENMAKDADGVCSFDIAYDPKKGRSYPIPKGDITKDVKYYARFTLEVEE
jgi:hypothetical protein